jgi:hypothetical protein
LALVMKFVVMVKLVKVMGDSSGYGQYGPDNGGGYCKTVIAITKTACML